MTQPAPKVSVVIATYSPGEAVHRVIDSLDAQTLSQDDIEVVFVDDGSPDDTYERLQRFAANRSNWQVHQIKNSGWPSRPRNVGIEHARGEYVMFMDHDDSLYPDGLRRAYEFARQNGADVLSPKESKTNDVWWGMSSFGDGNIPNVKDERGIDRLLPMIPHKLYRRQMLLDNNIRFPEGSRVLWEDWFINIDAYRYGNTVTVLADTPMYLWHASDTNSSHTFSPDRVDFWDRLEDMMEYIDKRLDGPQNEAARTSMMAHQVRTRVVDRCLRLVAKGDEVDMRVRKMALRRARKLLKHYATDDVLAHVPKKHLAQVHLMLARKMDLMKAFHEADLQLTGYVTAESAGWRGTALDYTATVYWEPKNPMVPGFRSEGGRTVRAVDRELARAIPPELLDHTDDPQHLVAELAIRSRAEYITWGLPFAAEPPRFDFNAAGALTLTTTGRGSIDLDTAALGRPMDDTVWDVRMRTEWLGMERKGPLRYAGEVLPLLADRRVGVGYPNASKGLSIDLAQRLRTFAIDAEPRAGAATPATSFTVPLDNVTVAVTAETTIDADMVFAIPDGALADDLSAEQQQELLAKLARDGELGARVVAADGAARLTGGAALTPGHYDVYARREGKLHKTKRSITVTDDGQLSFD